MSLDLGSEISPPPPSEREQQEDFHFLKNFLAAAAVIQLTLTGWLCCPESNNSCPCNPPPASVTKCLQTPTDKPAVFFQCVAFS